MTLGEIKYKLAILGYPNTRLLPGNILAVQGNGEFEYRMVLSNDSDEMNWKIQAALHELNTAENNYRRKLETGL